MAKPILKSDFSILNSVLSGILLLSVSCGAAPKSSTPTPAQAAGPSVVLPSGSRYRVELARTPEEQAQGLMFREALPPNAGMLFLFPESGIHKFWMKNTMIPLDIIWMDAAGKVVFVSANTPQCRADPCPNYGPDQPASNVLEIAGGMAKQEKAEVGGTIRFENVK
ncbi:MAG TPA: DUF192 domain-containing protein [Thermoanaerobaculia bacterium]